MLSHKSKVIKKILRNKRFCRTKKNSLFCNISVIVMVCFVLSGIGYYLSIINRSATQGYVINKLERGLDNLKNHNQRLEVISTELQDVERISAAGNDLSMIKGEGAEYLSVSNNQELAVR